MTDEKEEQDRRRDQVLSTLNAKYEERFFDLVAADDLSRELTVSRQELEILINPLLVREWVEKQAETLGGHFYLRLTPYGKEQYDEATGDNKNEKIREKLLAMLAAEYEKDVRSVLHTDSLASSLGIDWNKICINILIMQTEGLVGADPLIGGGHGAFEVSLTPAGKFAFDNPEPRTIFLSHAAVDEEIAKLLNRTIEQSFPGVNVFVSTDPEDLRPGDEWVEKILEKLAEAELLLALATERGLSRKWVWFETGAGWARDVRIVPCCMGKVRKGQLPSPFSRYQALNIDEEGDLRALVDIVAQTFGSPSLLLEFGELARELVRLDVRADERVQRPSTTSYSQEQKAKVEKGMSKLSEAEREALRQLLLEGQLTDRRAIDLVREKGLLKDNQVFIFPRIASETGFVQRIWEWNKGEDITGYQGPWQLNQQLRSVIENYMSGERV